MPSAKQAFGVVCVMNHIYVVGGYDVSGPQQTCERYDIITDKWDQLPNLPIKLLAANLVAINNRYIVAFGMSKMSNFELLADDCNYEMLL